MAPENYLCVTLVGFSQGKKINRSIDIATHLMKRDEIL